MDRLNLNKIIELHKLWLIDKSKGVRADLTEANLTGAYLTEANLHGAYLPGANLTEANLTEANLTGANLSGACLSGAYSTGCNLDSAVYKAEGYTNFWTSESKVIFNKAQLDFYNYKYINNDLKEILK